MNRDKTDDQLTEFSNNTQLKSNVDYYCKTGYGTPIVEKNASLTVSKHGPILLQDVHYIDEIAHFDRERIPERVVHAKGAGAFGYFEVTHSEITKYCSAKVFERIGKVTPIAVRFSTVGGESGSADTVRDPRGFAVKFYTDDGIWDLVGNNTPIFFIRDPILFPSFIHTQKRNPQTHLKDADMFWDFISLRPETTHQVMFLFSDRGIPDGYRHMNGYGSHTFKVINGHGDAFYCKFHYKTDQKIKNLAVDKANELAASDPDYGIRDLYNAIAKKNYPSWTFYIQIMTFDQAKSCSFNPFDVTKVWSHREYPLIPVGKLVLNKNPENYFTDVEQIAFSPSHMVPGIEPSPDKMLQGRLFSYPDTHRHRLGANYLQLKVNCPANQIWNYQRDGPQCIFNQNGTPNYYPNSFRGPDVKTEVRIQHPRFHISGDVGRFDTGDEDNFGQASVFYRKTLNEEERKRLINNIVNNLKNASKFIQENAVRNFSKVDQTFGTRLREGLANRSKL